MKYDFSVKETDGKDVSLKDFKGMYVVLYFYPKDNTGAWTKEALEFGELYEDFKKINTEILGISRDSLKSHKNFRDKYSLPFMLLSDEDVSVHNMFNVMKMKKLYGKEYLGVDRSTFVFNKKGELIKEYRNVKVEGHAREVYDFIKGLG